MIKWLANNKDIIQAVMWSSWVVGGAAVTFTMTNLDDRYIRFDEAQERQRGLWVVHGNFTKFKESLSAHLASDHIHNPNEITRQEFESYKSNTENRIGRLEELMIRIDDKIDRLIGMQIEN